MRAMIFRPIRLFVRVQRASLASARLFVCAEDGSILVRAERSGYLLLRFITLNCWQPIAPQVES
jgi:hypothetical protein